MLVSSVLLRMAPERNIAVKLDLLLCMVVSLLLFLFHEQTVRAFLVVKFTEIPATFRQLYIVFFLSGGVEILVNFG